MSTGDKKITVREAAELLGVSTDTIQRMINLGLIVAWRPNPLGRKQLMLESQVKALEENEVVKAAKKAKFNRDDDQLKLRLDDFY